MEKRCYICGVTGFEEALATCTECKSSYIHLYCMKVVPLEFSDDWICENCQETPQQVPEKPPRLPSADQNSKKKHSVHANRPSSNSKPSPDLQSFKELFIPPTHTMLKKARGGFSQGGGDSCKDTLNAKKIEREQRPNFGKLSVDKYLPNHPASEPTWKGSLRMGFAASVSSCDTIWGYPPAKVGMKAYEFSKTMPDVLRFEAIPRCTVWETLFNDGDPDKDDIGLYFFPIGHKSEDCYFRLVSNIEEKDIVLISCICGIKLLIFSSSCLDEKSREINKSFYLWGLFVPPGITFKNPDQNQIKTEPAVQHIPRNEPDVVVDMEIDMLGGAPVGRIEVLVPRASLLTSLKTSTAGSQPAEVQVPAVQVQVKPEKWDGPELPCPPGFPALQPVPRIPPGFEELGRLKYKTMAEILQSTDQRRN